jgi:hypothetical protein
VSVQKEAAAASARTREEWPNKPLYPVARAFTEIVSPFTIAAVLLFVVALLTDPHWLRSTVIAVVPIAVIPQGISLYMTHRGAVTDKFIRLRRQRHAFYAMTLGSVLIGTVLMFTVPTSPELRWVSTLAIGTLLLVMAVNTRIKISIHALIAAVAAVVLPVMTDSWLVLALTVLAWLGATWSRVYLERHDVVDVVLGSIVGALVGALFLLLAGVQL